MTEWAKIILGFAGLILLAIAVTDFHLFLAKKHYESVPLTEIQVYPKARRTLQQIEIDKCPWHNFGHLGKAIECQNRIMNRTDI